MTSVNETKVKRRAVSPGANLQKLLVDFGVQPDPDPLKLKRDAHFYARWKLWKDADKAFPKEKPHIFRMYCGIRGQWGYVCSSDGLSTMHEDDWDRWPAGAWMNWVQRRMGLCR